MSVYTNPPEWEAQGKKPPSSKRTEGWKPGDRVPASWLNWFWFSTVNSLREIAQAFVSHVTDKNNPHGVTVEQIGAVPSDAAIPAGGIIMWSGSIDSIPPGWALCDGQNGTPDLRDRFIVGAGGSYNVGNTGGSNSVTLSVSEIPSHSHSGSTNSAGNHSHGAGTYQTDTYTPPNGNSAVYFDLEINNQWGAQVGIDYHNLKLIHVQHSHKVTGTSGSAGSHSHSVSIGSTGGGRAHENRPPYYALCFIMKL